MSESSKTENTIRGDSGGNRLKVGVFLMLAVVIGVLAYVYRDQLSLSSILGYKQALLEYADQNPVLVYGLAFAVYVAVTGLSLPGAAPMTLLYGAVFGLVPGVILVSFASTTGSTIAFLVSRYLLRDAVQSKFKDRLARFNEALKREGAFYLFTLRLIPAVPFFVINLVMGLTPMRVFTFWWVSQLGMLPGTVVYVYAGTTLDPATLKEDGIGSLWQILLAFAILGVFPLAAKLTINRLRRRPVETDSN